MKQKYIRAIIIFIGLCLMTLCLANAQESATVDEIVTDLQFDLSLGNGCDEYFNEISGFADVIVENIELNGHILELMWIRIEVNNPITDFGEQISLYDLIDSGRIILNCEDSFIQVNQTLEIVDFPIKEIDYTLFPNPASDFVIVKARDVVNLTIYDVNGRIVLESNETFLERFKISLTKYQSGIYFIKVDDIYNRSATKRLIIK